MHSIDALCASLKKEFDSARVSESQAARAGLSAELNEFVRRLRAYRSEGEWGSIVLDGATLFSERVALFSGTPRELALRGCRAVDIAAGLKFTEPFPRALEAAVQSRDAVIALRTQAEVGAALSSAGSDGPDSDRALLLPILNEGRVVALLVALGVADAAGSALELIAGLAGMVLERRANDKQAVSIRPASVQTTAGQAVAVQTPPPWSHLSDAARLTHVRAQRFARVHVAEMQLAHSDSARAGREQRNIYLFLKDPVDAARDTYQSQFMQAQQMRDTSMLDYLHLELIRTLADGDESLLGDEYPGPLQ